MVYSAAVMLGTTYTPRSLVIAKNDDPPVRFTSTFAFAIARPCESVTTPLKPVCCAHADPERTSNAVRRKRRTWVDLQDFFIGGQPRYFVFE